MDRKWVSIAKALGYGIARGLVYYLLYIVFLPLLLKSVVQGSIAEISLSLFRISQLAFLYVFLALGIAETVLMKNPVVIPLRILSKMLGALLLLFLLNFGKMFGVIEYSSFRIEFAVDISPLLYTIILVSFLYGVVDAYSLIREEQ